ncbi:MAG: PAS domain-containing protein [Verrucomicrobiota bacterium]
MNTEQLQRLIGEIRDVVYSVDVETKHFNYLSPVFETMFGYAMEDVRAMGGRPEFLCQVIQHGKFEEQDQLLEDIKAGKVVKKFRHVAWWRCKDGTQKCIEDQWTNIHENTRLLSTAGVLRDITEQELLKQSREHLIQELQDAMVKIKTLSGLLPICAACKKIRDDKGYWNQVESYFAKRSGVQFTHGLCPDCTAKYFAELPPPRA